ncbi:MAG: Maf-like protein [Bacteroidaceae bacterium]|nr:Maf-like protein [Bacteroidaceae bacterium]
MQLGYRLVLASNSPRRRELLAGLGLDFEVRVMDGIDESYPDDIAVGEVPLFISRSKAAAYAASIADDELVITADTVVTVDDLILGKPADRAEAVKMLHLLSGRRHRVVTGVTFTTKERTHSFSVTTDVWFSKLSDEEIGWYVDNCRPFDKAGAYGIQEWIGYVGVERIDGSYFNVVGLPVQRLYRELLSFCAAKVTE